MSYQVRDIEGQKYIECLPGGILIRNEQDALDLVAVCGEHRIDRLLLYAENLAPGFFDLKTGLAGGVLQKFVNYFIRVAAVIPPELVNRGKFREMVLEANRGRHFHVSSDRQEAEEWLLRIR